MEFQGRENITKRSAFFDDEAFEGREPIEKFRPLRGGGEVRAFRMDRAQTECSDIV